MTHELSDKTAQRRENIGKDIVINVGQNAHYPLVGNTSGLIESYIQNRIEIHVHVLIGIVGTGSVNGHYCIIFNHCTEDLEFSVNSDISKFIVSDCHPAEIVGDGMKQAMLVDVRQFLELPERVTTKCIPSVIRLQTLDNCLSRCIHLADLATSRLIEKAFTGTGISAPVFISEDRELGVALEILRSASSGCVSVGQCENEMVERGSDVMKNISDYHGESGRGNVLDFDPDLIISQGISASLVDNGMMVSINPDYS